METKLLDYYLPGDLIAQQALKNRPESRLMVLERDKEGTKDRIFNDIIDYIDQGDCLVINDTRVIPARFYIQRRSGGLIEGLFIQLTGNGQWLVMLKGAGRLKTDEIVTMTKSDSSRDTSDEIQFRISDKEQDGRRRITPLTQLSHLEILDKYGVTPLPPYIKRIRGAESENIDRDRYQTVYANDPGSVAAPTAGLHFDNNLLARLKEKGIRLAHVTLHVGPGTFKPVSADNLKDHQMHSEQYSLDENNAGIINETIKSGGKIIAVGTTSVRTLETLGKSGTVKAAVGWTDIFITPGYKFGVVNGMITNFHLPKSTLLALVCAFVGVERTLTAYRRAVENKYRFYSYGDAMLII